MSYRRSHIGFMDDILKVGYGNNNCFAEYQMTFWLPLPSWFCKVFNNAEQDTRKELCIFFEAICSQ